MAASNTKADAYREASLKYDSQILERWRYTEPRPGRLSCLTRWTIGSLSVAKTDARTAELVAAAIDKLEADGPTLGRPLSTW